MNYKHTGMIKQAVNYKPQDYEPYKPRERKIERMQALLTDIP